MARSGKQTSTTLTQKVLKVMTLFTGMQFFIIFCSIIKTKLVALWLSADGVGLFGILNSTMETTGNLTEMGLRQSAVRDVAQSANKPSLLARTATIVRRWSLITGLLGAIVVSALCLPLSEWFFKDISHWWMFALLSLAMLCNAKNGGEQSLLQGTGRFKQLLRANTWGAAGGLLLSIPLYRWGGLTGVVWSVIIYATCGLAGVLCFRMRTKPVTNLKNKQIWHEGKGFMHLGMLMALAAFITNMAQMAFMAFLNGASTLSEVGYYQAGITLTVRYMGLIFTALSMEYYPRLSANIFSNRRTEIFVNYEARLLLTLLIPVISLFLLFRHWIVLLLYRPDFEAMIPFISWAVLSCAFKATSWCMAFVILAKGDGKTFVVTEGIDAVVGLGLCIAGYKLYGLAGVGIAYIAWYALYTFMTGWVYRRRYRLKLASSTLWMTLLCFLTGVGALETVTHLPYWLSSIILGGIAVGSLPFLRKLYLRR